VAQYISGPITREAQLAARRINTIKFDSDNKLYNAQLPVNVHGEALSYKTERNSYSRENTDFFVETYMLQPPAKKKSEAGDRKTDIYRIYDHFLPIGLRH
jgi:hypothetical protein